MRLKNYILKTLVGSDNLIVLLLLGLSLITPGSENQIFSGVPLNSPTEFWLFMLYIAVLGQRIAEQKFDLNFSRFTFFLSFLLLVVILGKSYLFKNLPPDGFAARYRSLVAVKGYKILEPGQAEFDTDNFFGDRRITRFDRRIDFENEWQMGFLNTRSHHFYQSVPENPMRERTPFEAIWNGTFAAEIWRDSVLQIEYVGECSLKVGDLLFKMPESYTARNCFQIPFVELIPALASHPFLLAPYPVKAIPGLIVSKKFELNYRFAIPTMVAEKPGNPNAALSVKVTNNRFSVKLLEPAKNTSWLLYFALAVDMIIAAFLIVFIRGLFQQPDFLPDLLILICFGSLSRFYLAKWYLPVAMVLLSILFILRKPTFIQLCIAVLALFAIWYVPVTDLASILYRIPGMDPLTYEHFARNMLSASTLHDFLQGVEPVFYYQPLFRYYLALMHVVFGNGDQGWMIFNHFLLISSVLHFHRILDKGHFNSAFIMAIFAMIAFVQHYMVPVLFAGFMETAALTFMLYGIIAGLARCSVANLLLMPFCLGIASIFRLNYLPVSLFILVVLLVRNLYKKYDLAQILKRVVLALTVFLLMYALVPVHNYVFGNKLVFTTNSATIDANLVFNPKDLSLLCSSEDVRQKFLARIAMLNHSCAYMPLNILLIVWLLFILFAIIRTYKCRSLICIADLALLLSPLILMFIHLFYLSSRLRLILSYHFLMMVFVSYWISTLFAGFSQEDDASQSI